MECIVCYYGIRCVKILKVFNGIIFRIMFVEYFSCVNGLSFDVVMLLCSN